MHGWDRSAKAWVDFVDLGDLNRIHLIDPAVNSLVGDVEGLQLLDVGAGEGRTCRQLEAKGARVFGLEPIFDLASTAFQRGSSSVVGRAECLPVKDGAFDGVLSIVTLVDIEGYRQAVAEFSRVLKPGGFVVAVNLNPFATAANRGWEGDGEGAIFRIDNYLEERGDAVAWSGISVTNFHRPLGAYFAAFLEPGFILEFFSELEPPVGIPKLDLQRRVPWFHAMRWRKPG